MGRKALLREVNQLVSSGLRKSAIDIINEYLENTPSDPFVLRALGRIYLLEKKPDLAVKYLQLSLKNSQPEVVLRSNSTPYEFDTLNHDDLHYIEDKSAEIDDNYYYDSEEKTKWKSELDTTDASEINKLNIEIFSAQESNSQLDNKNQINSILQTETDEKPELVNTEYDFDRFSDDLDFVLPSEIELYDEPFDLEALALPEVEYVIEEDDDIDELFFDVNEKSIDDEFDWDGLEDFDEIDEPGLIDHLSDYLIITEGKVSRIERAKQIATEVIRSYDWGIKNLPLLQQVFYENGWGAARVSIEHELTRGLTPDELELALFVRRLWTDNQQYWISFIHITSNQPFQETRAAYKNMSWREALRIIRVFDGLPSEDEIQLFIDQIYDDWYCSPTSQKQYKAFIRYLKYRTGSVRHTLPGNELFSFTNSYEHESLIDSTRDIIKYKSGVDKLKQQGIDIEQILISYERKYQVVPPLTTISDPFILKAYPRIIRDAEECSVDDEDEQENDSTLVQEILSTPFIKESQCESLLEDVYAIDTDISDTNE